LQKFAFLGLAVIFFGVWIVSKVAFHIASGLIHILLVIGFISLIIHFFTSRNSA
jgi:hypothetical protein